MTPAKIPIGTVIIINETIDGGALKGARAIITEQSDGDWPYRAVLCHPERHHPRYLTLEKILLDDNEFSCDIDTGCTCHNAPFEPKCLDCVPKYYP